MSTSDRDALAKVLYDAEGFHAADHWGAETAISRGRYEGTAEAVLASGWLAAREAEAAARALERFADTRGVNVGTEDSEWWSGYRQAQRECLHAAAARAADLRAGVEK